MPMSASDAIWEGSFTDGSGSVKLETGEYEMDYAFTFSPMVEDGRRTNPAEMISAAHASCFSLALARTLTDAGHPPARIHARSKVLLTRAGAGLQIPRIELQTGAVVPGIDQGSFESCVEEAKANCPVSKLLAGTEMTVSAILLETA